MKMKYIVMMGRGEMAPGKCTVKLSSSELPGAVHKARQVDFLLNSSRAIAIWFRMMEACLELILADIISLDWNCPTPFPVPQHQVTTCPDLKIQNQMIMKY
jgi:hypothetical protein